MTKSPTTRRTHPKGFWEKKREWLARIGTAVGKGDASDRPGELPAVKICLEQV